MALSTSEFVGVVNDLIETCKDGEKGFREAAEGVQNSAVRTLFMEFAQQRAQYARELQARVAKLGETPETGGSAAGAMHRGWINLKSAISGKNDKAIIDEAERGEDTAVEAYQKALTKDIPADLKSVIETQYQGIQAAHNRVSALKHGTSA